MSSNIFQCCILIFRKFLCKTPFQHTVGEGGSVNWHLFSFCQELSKTFSLIIYCQSEFKKKCQTCLIAFKKKSLTFMSICKKVFKSVCGPVLDYALYYYDLFAPIRILLNLQCLEISSCFCGLLRIECVTFKRPWITACPLGFSDHPTVLLLARKQPPFSGRSSYDNVP